MPMGLDTPRSENAGWQSRVLSLKARAQLLWPQYRLIFCNDPTDIKYTYWMISPPHLRCRLLQINTSVNKYFLTSSKISSLLPAKPLWFQQIDYLLNIKPLSACNIYDFFMNI